MDAREVAFIRENLSEDAAARLTDEDLYYLIDVLATYYAESGVLDAEPDEEGFVDLPEDAMVEFIQQSAKKELQKDFVEQDLLEVMDLDLAFGEE